MNEIQLKLCDIQGRLFELSVDRRESGFLFWTEAESLSDSPVLCNKKDVGITFDDAMKMICKELPSIKGAKRLLGMISSIISYRSENSKATVW